MAVGQLAALLLLLACPLVPVLEAVFPGHGLDAGCTGDHARCGCTPERAAAGTCCCARRKPDCCARDGRGAAAGDRGGEKPSRRHLSTAPCGGSPKFIAASLANLPYLLPRSCLTAAPEGERVLFSPFTAVAVGRHPEPPDPPPESV
jgi:hypothetical protein